MTEQALQSIGAAALALNQPDEALAALDAYALTVSASRSSFLARRSSRAIGHQLDAAADYQTIYSAISRQRTSSRGRREIEFSSQQQHRPANSGHSRRTADCARRDAFRCQGMGRRAQRDIRILRRNLPALTASAPHCACWNAKCNWASSPSAMTDLQNHRSRCGRGKISALAQWYRSQQREPDMAAAVESAVSRAPASHWAEAALF